MLVNAINKGHTCMHKVRRAPLDGSSTCLARWYQISLFNHFPPPIYYLIKLSGWVGVLLPLGELKTVQFANSHFLSLLMFLYLDQAGALQVTGSGDPRAK